MKKKLCALLLAVALSALLLTGCGGGGSSGTVSGGSQVSSNGKTSIQLLGASWYAEDGDVRVFFSAAITNKNTRTSGGSQVSVTSRDKDGRVLNVSTTYSDPVASGDTIRYSDHVLYRGEAPATIELSIGEPMFGYSDEKVAKASEFAVSNLSLINTGYSYHVTGDVTNNSTDKHSVRVSVLFKKHGEIIGGCYDYVNQVEAGKSGAFDIYVPECFDGFESYEVVANAA